MYLVTAICMLSREMVTNYPNGHICLAYSMHEHLFVLTHRVDKSVETKIPSVDGKDPEQLHVVFSVSAFIQNVFSHVLV